MLRGVLTLAVLLAAVYSSEVALDYGNQVGWGGVCNDDASKKQSPVDVISPEESTVVKVDGKLLELPAAASDVEAINANNLNAVKFSFAETIKYTIPGIDVEGTVSQLHIHWGAEDGQGSEHLLNGKTYSAEIHLVTSYGEDGKFAVVNRFFKVGAANAQVEQMITSAKDTPAADRVSKIADFDLAALYPSDIENIITYEGSLTTPECSEVVYWVIVPELLTISTEQLEALRDVPLGDGNGDSKEYNWREKQDLNDRTFTAYKSSSAALLTSHLLIVLAIFVNIIIMQ